MISCDTPKKDIHSGITTRKLDVIAENFIRRFDAFPSFKGYNGFRGGSYASFETPNDHVLEDGDIISIDIGVKYNSYHGDSAWTYPVGAIDIETQKLLEVTEKSLYQGLLEIKPGERLSNISHAIQQFVEANGFSIVREYAEHRIGQELHEDPPIPH
jgi:methionyl aminopeptidase